MSTPLPPPPHPPSPFLKYSKPLSPLTVQALAGMRALGLQGRLSCEGVLQSARSIEVALSATAPSVSAESFTLERKAAVERSRNLLDFVDRFADELLLESGETGRWFIDGPCIGDGSPDEGDGDEKPDGWLERERQKERAAAAAVQPPPANKFVEQLCSIAWLPVLATTTNPLLPWQVGVHSVCLGGLE